ncbi:MAG: ABC transporter ATP-binding protein [Armatimonadetes bacterium]|nr:ABC transporter ATP-binding protein [Armatimonadota bacterium]
MIALEGVWLTIDGREILKDVNLFIEAGEISCIMGLSGCGKTSTLRLMMGLIRPTRGRVVIDGQDIVRMSERDLNRVRRKMGMVFQYAALFDSLTVYENVAFGLTRQRKRYSPETIAETVRSKLEAVGMEGTEPLLPAELSGGMQKRVGMARALALDPQIVLYDEPTSGLDPVMSTIIDDLIVRLRDRFGVTSVVVSHEIQSVMHISNKIAMIYNGSVVACGTPEEIMQHPDPVVQQFISGSSEGPIMF